MKYLKQLGIILTVSFAGELLHAVLPLPVPASIYGLLLMMAALITGILPLDKVKETGDFLIEIMPLMFIPAGVGLLASWETLRPVLVPILVILVVTTVLVMAVAGRTTQAVIRRKQSREKLSEEAFKEGRAETGCIKRSSWKDKPENNCMRRRKRNHERNAM